MFDGGSQRTYVTKRLRNRLKLKTIRQEDIEIHVFGGGKHKSKTHDIVQFAINGRNSKMRVLIEAIVVDTISSDLEPQPIEVVACEYDHLKDLFLADGWIDESYQTFEILIGLDNYWKLVTGNVIRGEDGPVALETRLGYVLSGNSKRIIQIQGRRNGYSRYSDRCTEFNPNFVGFGETFLLRRSKEDSRRVFKL